MTFVTTQMKISNETEELTYSEICSSWSCHPFSLFPNMIDSVPLWTFISMFCKPDET